MSNAMRKRLGLVLLVTVVLAPRLTFAGVIIEGAKVVVSEAPRAQPQQLAGVAPDGKYNPYTFVGRASEAVEPTTSVGDRQTFSKAVKAIVPPGWKGYLKDDRITQIVDMTWRGSGRPWTGVLGDLLVSHRLVATVDWSRKEISFDIAPSYK